MNEIKIFNFIFLWVNIGLLMTMIIITFSHYGKPTNIQVKESSLSNVEKVCIESHAYYKHRDSIAPALNENGYPILCEVK